MRLDISIREKLVVYYVLLGIFSIFIVGVYSYLNSKEAILNRTFDQLTSIREEKKKSIESFFNDRTREIKLISNSNEIKSLLPFLKKDSASIAYRKNNEEDYNLRDFLLQGNYYETLTIVDSANKLIHCEEMGKFNFSNKTTDTLRSEIQKLSKEVFSKQHLVISDFKIINNRAQLFVSTPIFDIKEKMAGILILTIGENAINKIMYEDTPSNGLGKSGESYIVGNDYLMRSASRFQDSSILRIAVHTTGVKKAFANEPGTRKITDYRGITVLSSFSKLNIPGLNWAILSELDDREVMYPVTSIRDQVILITTIISLILIAIAFVISNKITIPLRNLVIATNKISLGEYGHTVPIYTKDEIGELTEAFNSMSIQIKEQTKELIEREKRLNHFYKATKDGIILHERGKPVLINQALCNLTNYTFRELHKKKINEIIKINNNERYLSHPNKSFTYETIAYRKDGTYFPVEVQENPIEYEGEIISSSVIRNITERIESQKALNQERKKRLSSFIDGQENERKRLSRELHDSLGQSLIGIKMRLESISENKINKAFETLAVVKDFVNKTIDEVRRMSNNLMPAVLSEFGLTTAINNICKQTADNSGINIYFEHQNISKDLPDKTIIYIFRIVQEALNNTVKHSNATEMNIMLMQEERYMILLIEDNGKGFDPNGQKSQGNGLYNMRERVNLLQGTISIAPSLGKGLVINIKIPLKTSTNG